MLEFRWRAVHFGAVRPVHFKEEPRVKIQLNVECILQR
jgi:hypothetical protein